VINFDLDFKGPISEAFLRLNILDFSSSCNYVANLPYARNSNTADELIVLRENKGTCSTKHALLKRLLEEHEILDVKLMLGIFLLSAENTPKASEILNKSQVPFIPEAHCYLRLQNEIMDFTFPPEVKLHFEKSLLKEIVISPSEIGPIKAKLQFDFIKNWLPLQSNINKTPNEIWEIREEIINRLSIN
jgi:hypothetical protein